MTESVIIEFISDPSGLQPTEDKLAALGKIDAQAANSFKQTNTELKKREQLITSNTAEASKLKNSYDGLRNSVLKESQVMKLSAAEFKATGKTLEQLVAQQKASTVETKKGTDETAKSTIAQKSLKTELLAITQQLARLKLAGQDNTEQYKQLSAQASKYRDALGDVSREINRAASDTRKLDTVIEFATGVAGAFSIAQGAAGLFGDKSEELQEVLLRVQSAMAVLNGLQAIQNILQKESNLIRFVSNQQLKVAVIVTNLETAAQSKNIIVKGLAAGAMRVLNAVMSANPAFLLIAAFTALAGALVYFTGKSKDSEEAVKKLNQQLFDLNNNIDAAITGVRNQAEINQARLDQLGAKSSEQTRQRIKDLRRENVEALTGLYKSQQQLQALNAQVAAGTIKDDEKVQESKDKIIETQHKYYNLVRDNNQTIKVAEINAIKEAADERKSANEKSIEDSKKAAEKRREFRLKELEDIKAGIELQLLEVAKGSQAEIDLKKKLSIAELNIGLENEKLTANQRKLLIQQSFKEREKLEKDSSAEVRKRSLENLQSNLNAELQEIDISNQRKEDLTIQLLEVQRQLELAAVIGNKQKEKEINAKFDKEISDQAVAIRKAGLDEELRLVTAQAGARQRAATRDAGDPNKDIQVRINAINELLAFETDSINKRKALNDSLFKDGLISAKEFQLTNADLALAEAIAVEDAELRKQDAYKQTAELKAERDRQMIQNAFEISRQTLDTLATLYDFVSATETNALETQRQRIKDLQDAGAISEKEAKERFKRLDVEERKIKQQQAQRNKAIEVFNALLAIPAAFLKGLKDGGPILAALYAGLAGAQAALIAARPIPKFGRGKKNQYEGVGQVGETGPELIEKSGKYYYAEKPQIIWLSKSTKVYSPKETIDMINKPLPHIDKRIMNFSNSTSSKLNIDYQKLGKAVGENIPQVGFNFDENGFTQYQRDKESFTRYLNKRRSF